MRAGPGLRYPIDWVIKVAKHMPVEVLESFETWRRVRDWQGTEGWVHQSMLAPRRYALVTGETRTLRRRPEADAPPVAKLETGVVGQILECKDQWCRLDAQGFRGWLKRADVWGVYPNEVVN